MMKITFIAHSCFSIEFDNSVLLFDYYGDGQLPEWSSKKMIYVLNSHKHSDHFNLCIFELAKKYPKIHFFLGSDIKLRELYLKRNHVEIDSETYISHLHKRCELQFDDDFYVRTLRSTDVGVAFVIRHAGKWIYHAGDLNWWHWEGEDDNFNKEQERCYKEEIQSIRNISFDVAFVPMDGRLEDAYYLGADYFLRTVSAEVVFPMHMWGQFSLVDRYRREGHAGGEHLVEIGAIGQSFDR